MKSYKNLKGIILVILLVSLIVLFQHNSSAACTLSTLGGCGAFITTPGHGAVELCNNCFACGGIQDGVCPAWYSTGEIGQNVNVTLRFGNQSQDRLTGASFEYYVSYSTPKEACSIVGGQFFRAYVKNNYEDAWTLTVMGENTNVSTNTNYVMVECNNVPRTPSCDQCIDVDCTNEVRGLAYESILVNGVVEKAPLEGARMTIVSRFSPDNQNLTRMGEANAQGEFNILNSYSGNVTVICTANGYEPVVQNVTLKSGKNLIDCRLTEATCDANCTVPSAQYGERVCDQRCQGINGCSFGPVDTRDDAIKACDGRTQGFFSELGTQVLGGQVVVSGYNCCNTPASKSYPIFDISDSNDVSHLITRSYNKILEDGSAVVLNLIVYKK